MNKLIFILSLVMTTSVLAADLPTFSAFVSGDKLYVTMMMDTCNSHHASLSLAQNCKKADPGMPSTTDYVTTCDAQIQVRSTKMFCTDMKTAPKAFEINLKDYNLRNTIDTLKLTTYGTEEVEVDLKNNSDLGAFVTNNELQFTVLGDTCNHIGAKLEVDKLCDKDRLTRNSVVTCNAKLLVFQTEMYCGNTDLVPRTTTVKLKDTQVDPYAKVLALDYSGTELEVDLK